MTPCGWNCVVLRVIEVFPRGQRGRAGSAGFVVADLVSRCSPSALLARTASKQLIARSSVLGRPPDPETRGLPIAIARKRDCRPRECETPLTIARRRVLRGARTPPAGHRRTKVYLAAFAASTRLKFASPSGAPLISFSATARVDLTNSLVSVSTISTFAALILTMLSS